MRRGKWVLVLAACVVLAAVYAVGGEGALAAVLAVFPLIALWERRVPAPEVIRAQKFELVDSEGKVRAALTLGPDGTPTVSRFAADGVRVK